MRTIIAGSRGCTDMHELVKAIRTCGWRPTVVISGGARGADLMGEVWAQCFNVPYEVFPANWRPNGVYDHAAGYKRNEQMADAAEALIALWDGSSPGTKHMIDIARRKGLRVHVHLTGGVGV